MLMGSQNQIIIDPDKTYTPSLGLLVGFKKERIDAINGPDLKYRWLASHLWLRVIVTYDDAYQVGRETSYWVQMSGTGTLAPRNNKFNYQK
jgi:hypothetical protein